MLKVNLEEKLFVNVPDTGLRGENILERHDLQKSIVNSWELFRNEINIPDTFLVGQEVTVDDITQNSIDLLAFDSSDSSLIVIELKRDKHKLQLLQALSYAAAISQWDSAALLSKIQKSSSSEQNELIEIIENSDLDGEIKVILIAEEFDPEVILTANWLSTTYSLSISAFSLNLFSAESSLFVIADQRYPLKELKDSYVQRKKRTIDPNRDISWNDILPNLEYSFAERGIELCQKMMTGYPTHRRFRKANHDGFKWINVNFRNKHINVYLFGDNELKIQKYFGNEIAISSWRDGLSFNITTPDQFEALVKWLSIE